MNNELIVDEKEYWNEKYWKLFHEIQEKLKELDEIKKECVNSQLNEEGKK